MTAPARKRPRVTELTVRRTEWITPHMIRVVAGGPGFANFKPNEYTDKYVKLLFPVPGVTYPEPFDIGEIRDTMPREAWPTLRTYTVRSYDPQAEELTIDFVYHGDRGLAGPWAARAEPGDLLRFQGPGGAYAPSADADWHLLAGDEAALPAIAAALEALPPGAPARACIEVANEDEQQRLDSPGDVEITWLHRDNGDGDLLRAVSAMEFLPGRVHAFVHGEAEMMKQIRRHLLNERGVERGFLSLSGYWRQGLNEEGFRDYKAEEKRREEEAAA